MNEVANRGERRVLVEVAVDGVLGARAARQGGADRIELCCALELGGLTPSVGSFEAVRAAVEVPVFCMLRPRAGDFLYDDAEFAVLLADAAALRRAGADGFVAGFLTADGAVDGERLRWLREAVGALPVTFHRAFDLCREPQQAIDDLVALGVERVLSSGQAANAELGVDGLRSAVQHAGGRLSVMAGGGVRAANVRRIVDASGVGEVHLSAAVQRDGGMRFRRDGIPMGVASGDEYSRRETDRDQVAALVAALRGGATAPG